MPGNNSSLLNTSLMVNESVTAAASGAGEENNDTTDDSPQYTTPSNHVPYEEAIVYGKLEVREGGKEEIGCYGVINE